MQNPNVNHTNYDDNYNSEEEEQEYDYPDNIDPGEYNLEDDYEEEESDNEGRIPEPNVSHANVEDGLPEPTICGFTNEEEIGDLWRPEIFYEARE